MLIELLPRIWIADKVHSKSKIKNIIILEEKLKHIYNNSNFIERQHSYSLYLEKMIRFLYYYTVLNVKPIIIVDSNIHTRQDAYTLVIAYMSFYTKENWKQVYRHIQAKTIPFQLSSFSMGALHLLLN